MVGEITETKTESLEGRRVKVKTLHISSTHSRRHGLPCPPSGLSLLLSHHHLSWKEEPCS